MTGRNAQELLEVSCGVRGILEIDVGTADVVVAYRHAALFAAVLVDEVESGLAIGLDPSLALRIAHLTVHPAARGFDPGVGGTDLSVESRFGALGGEDGAPEEGRDEKRGDGSSGHGGMLS